MEVNVQSLERAAIVWQTFLRTLMVTSVFYLAFQLYFGIACLIGAAILFGIDSSFVLTGADTLTFGTTSSASGVLFIIGMVGAMLCGLITFVISAAIFAASKCRILHGFSLLILTVCTITLLIPILNLFPIMWFWNWYIGWSNLKIAKRGA